MIRMPRLWITDELRVGVLARLKENASYTDISLEFGVGFHVIHKIKKEAGLLPPGSRRWWRTAGAPPENAG